VFVFRKLYNQQTNDDNVPRNSLRKQLLIRLDALISASLKHAIRLKLLGLPSDRADYVLSRFRAAKKVISSSRYLARGRYRKRTGKFDWYLDERDDNRLSDTEFRFHFRISRETFWELVELLKDHEAFTRRGSDSRGPPPKPAHHQLLVLLKYYGCEGNQASSKALSTFFATSNGVVDTCRNNALQALLSLEDRIYFWPDAGERRAIAMRIKQQYRFPNCVGLIDGTLLPLASRPLLHGENYLSRKRFYAIVMLVVLV
jgi:hypothetical protein